jgi:alpha-1,2-mannosyltransferase
MAAVLLVALGAAIISGQAGVWRNTVEDRDAQDFGIFLTSVKSFAEGHSLYGSVKTRNLTQYRSGQLNLNLPHTHLFLLPLAGLAPRTALLTWTVASVFVVALCAWNSLRALRWRLPALAWLALAVYLLSWGPAAAFSLTAQLSLLLAGPVTAAWLAARRGDRARAGAWLGLAAAAKPFLFLFVPYLMLKRDWRALGALLLAATATVLAGVLVFTPEAYREWFAQLSRITWGTHYFNASIAGAAERLLGRSFYTGMGRHPWLEIAIVAPATIVIAAVTLARAGRPRPVERARSTDVEWAAILLAALLISPLGWVYYLWIALWPVAATIGHAQPWRHLRRVDLLLVPGLSGWLWFGKMTEWGQPHPLATATLASMYFWALLSLWTWTVSGLDRAAWQVDTDFIRPT